MTPRQPASAEPYPILCDRYDVLERVGAGTAANVFRVRDRRSGIVRAAKVLKPENAGVPATLTRFEDEYRILRTLHHPHLPEIYDYGWTDDGGRCLVMEFVDGEALDAYFRTRPRDLWVILYQLCETLTFIHNHQLLHQDIKPSNLLVMRTTAFGEEIPLVKLIDFGLTHRRSIEARAEMVGTPEYMAPEVVRGESPLTRAADYYSLGVALYELLTGGTPFQGRVAEVLRAHLERVPVIEEEELEWTELYPHVRALLAKDKRARLEGFEELRRTVVTRLTGGIGALDRAYGAARIESLGMIGKTVELRELLDATLPVSQEKRPPRVSVDGQPASGRGHFLGAARSEWRIRGVSSWQLGEESDAAWLLNRPESAPMPATDKDFEQAWAHVEQVAARTPVWIVACGELTPEEARLYDYFETGRTLSGPAVRRNLGFVTATAADRGRPDSESDGAVRVALPTLSPRDTGFVVDQFRGEMLRTADARLIADLLKETRESGEVMLLLRRLIAQGGLLFEAQRWRVVPERAREIAREPASTGGHLVLPLSSVQKRVMVCLACHPGPVPVGWIPGIAGLDDGAASAALHDLRLRHLLEPVDLKGTAAVRTTSRTLERAVLRGVEAKELSALHRAYVKRLTARVEPGADDLRMLALHQEGSGDDRAAYRTRRRLFKDLWQRRAYGEVEQICRDALASEGIRFGLARAYLRELVNVLWAQNMTAHAYHEMTAFAARFGDVPRGLLPKYCRGLMDARGPKAGLEFIEEALKQAQAVNDVLVARIEVEHALCLYNLSRYKIGLKAAARAQKLARRLSPREQCRLAIYWALLQPGVGTRTAGRYLAKAHNVAVAHRFADELAMIQVLRVIAAIDSGRPEHALRIIATAMRSVTRERLVLRQYQFYGQAASAYSELGDHARAIKYREKTVWMAQYLGQKALLASSWYRVALYSERYGAFGNAVRYYERAMPLLRDVSRASDFILARIFQHDLHVAIGSAMAKALASDATAALAATSDVGEQGTMSIVGADQLLRYGRWSEARHCYAGAHKKCLIGGRRDDAMRAAAGEAHALLLLGKRDACRRLLDSARATYRGFENVDARARHYHVELLCRIHERRPRGDVLELIRRCEAVVPYLQMSIRIDVLRAMFRGYARIGYVEDARRAAGSYEDCIRSIVANLEHAVAARGFLARIGYLDAIREIRVLERQSARIGSVDAGTLETH